MLSRVCDFTVTWSSWAVGLLLLGTVGISCLGVYTRYVVNDPLAWTEQVSRILFVWMTFLGATILYRRHEHIAMDIFLAALPIRLSEGIRRLNDFLLLALFAVLLIFGLKLSFDNVAQTYGALDISPSFFYFAAPVSALLFLLYWCEDLMRRRDAAEPDSGGISDQGGLGR